MSEVWAARPRWPERDHYIGKKGLEKLNRDVPALNSLPTVRKVRCPQEWRSCAVRKVTVWLWDGRHRAVWTSRRWPKTPPEVATPMVSRVCQTNPRKEATGHRARCSSLIHMLYMSMNYCTILIYHIRKRRRDRTGKRRSEDKASSVRILSGAIAMQQCPCLTLSRTSQRLPGRWIE